MKHSLMKHSLMKHSLMKHSLKKHSLPQIPSYIHNTKILMEKDIEPAGLTDINDIGDRDTHVETANTINADCEKRKKGETEETDEPFYETINTLLSSSEALEAAESKESSPTTNPGSLEVIFDYEIFEASNPNFRVTASRIDSICLVRKGHKSVPEESLKVNFLDEAIRALSYRSASLTIDGCPVSSTQNQSQSQPHDYPNANNGNTDSSVKGPDQSANPGGFVSSAISWTTSLFSPSSTTSPKKSDSPSLSSPGSNGDLRKSLSTLTFSGNGGVEPGFIQDALVSKLFDSSFVQGSWRSQLPSDSQLISLKIDRMFFLFASIASCNYYQPWFRLIMGSGIIVTSQSFNKYSRENNDVELAIATSSCDIFTLSFPSMSICRLNRDNSWDIAGPILHTEWLDNDRILASLQSGTVLVIDCHRKGSDDAVKAVRKINTSAGLIAMTQPLEGRLQRIIQLHRKQAIPDFSICKRLQVLALACKDGFLRIFDISSFKLLGCLQSYYGGFSCVCWSFDGQYLLAGSEDDLVSLWKITSNYVKDEQTLRINDCKLLCRGKGHKGWVSRVMFLSTSTQEQVWFASCGQDGLFFQWMWQNHKLSSKIKDKKDEKIKDKDDEKIKDKDETAVKQQDIRFDFKAGFSNEMKGSFQMEFMLPNVNDNPTLVPRRKDLTGTGRSRFEVPVIGPENGTRLQDEPFTDLQLIHQDAYDEEESRDGYGRSGKSHFAICSHRGRILSYHVDAKK